MEKIYNSNIFTLIRALRSLGIDAYDAGVVHDDPQKIAARIEENIQRCDAVITTGGASVGKAYLAERGRQSSSAMSGFRECDLLGGAFRNSKWFSPQ